MTAEINEKKQADHQELFKYEMFMKNRKIGKNHKMKM